MRIFIHLSCIFIQCGVKTPVNTAHLTEVNIKNMLDCIQSLCRLKIE